jgi:hypothetical protein
MRASVSTFPEYRAQARAILITIWRRLSRQTGLTRLADRFTVARMKPFFRCVLSMALLVFVGARAEQAPTNSPTSSRNEEIAQLETAWNSAHLRSDADAVDKLCTDDLTVVVPAMAPMSKKAAVGTLRAGRIKFTRYETTDTQIRLYNGDTAIVTELLN